MTQQHCHFLFCHWPRWLTDCYYAESARSVWKMSVASRRPPPGQRRLVSPPPCSPPLLGSPSSPLHAPCPAVFLTRHAEKSPSTFRTKRTSQRGSSIANCLCWSTSMHSEYCYLCWATVGSNQGVITQVALFISQGLWFLRWEMQCCCSSAYPRNMILLLLTCLHKWL